MDVKKNVKAMKKVIEKNELGYEYYEETNTFAGCLPTNSTLGRVRSILRVMDDEYACFSVLPMRAPEERRIAVAELLCRINNRIVYGSFDQDFNDGEIKFSYVMSADEFMIKPEAKLAWILGLSKQMLDRFGDPIVKVILGAVDPQRAVDEALGEDSIDSAAKEEKDVAGMMEAADEDNAMKDEKIEEASSDGGISANSNLPSLVKEYRLDGMSIAGDLKLEKIVQAMRKFRTMTKEGAFAALPDRPKMNVLLWGPPGTGKSEFVNYLGQELGCPVWVKTGSDILDRFVGESEKAIREAFDEAEKEGAILFFDELDGMMQNRAAAHANWEVTQVNELLRCMEKFKGIMIGATNLKDSMDPAVLRRFTYKLEFKYLDDKGKDIFFERAFRTPLSDVEAERLHRIENLTPGDFRTVSQALFYLDDDVGNAERLAGLERESALKQCCQHKCIGFAA